MVLQVHGKKSNYDQISSGAIMVATHSIVAGSHKTLTKCCIGKLPGGDGDDLSETV